MPLSEREQQILDELEKELSGGRRSSSQASAAGTRERFLGAKVGALLVVVGIVMLVWFFASGFVVVGVASFGLMVGGIVLGASSIRTEMGGNGGPGERIARTVGGWEQSLRRRYRNDE